MCPASSQALSFFTTRSSSDEILAHITPIAFRHINFQGIYRFPLERYLARLLPSVRCQKITAGAKRLIHRKPLLLAGFGKHP